MEIDVDYELGAAERSVSFTQVDEKAAGIVKIARTYTTSLDDMWDALTNADRIPRWFLPISGDLKLGGHYQFQGNAGGTITHCSAPSFLGVTWEFAQQVSWLEVRLEKVSTTSTRFELSHTLILTEHWDEYGPGALGVGWEMGLLGMEMHITKPNEPKADERTFHTTPEGKALHIGSSEGWYRAAVEAGTDPDIARTAANHTTTFYTGVEIDPD